MMRDMLFNKFQNQCLMNDDVGDEQKEIIIRLNMENLMYDGTDLLLWPLYSMGKR